mmetsp:Transcript_10263/g.18859  ORF Transcript_10263/g.18859 Transcript_10263/m.18859 type:complete len:218 (-) Transcript_10263:692-1345(-)
MKVDVVLLGSNTTAFADLESHCTGNHVTRSQVLGGRSVTLHEALTLRVTEDSSFATAAFSDEAASTVDTSGVELNKLGVLDGEASAKCHCVSVTSASVSTGCRKVGTAIATSGENGVLGMEAVKGTVLHVHGNAAHASSLVIHDEIERKVLDKVARVEGKTAAIQGVKKCMSGAVCGARTAVSLATLTKLKRLPTESTLVNFTILGTREGKTERLKL